MKNIILSAAIYFVLPFIAHASESRTSTQLHCINAATDAIFDSQVKELKLSSSEKAKYAVEWYSQIIEGNPQYLETVKQIEILCTKAWVMAVPLPTPPQK